MVYFGPGRFVKCARCGAWSAIEWAEGEAQIQVYATTMQAREARTTTRAAVFVSVGALATKAGSTHVISYPIPLSLRAQSC